MIAKGKTVQVLDPIDVSEEYGVVVDGPIYDCGGIFYTIKFANFSYSLLEEEIVEVKWRKKANIRISIVTMVSAAIANIAKEKA